MSILTGANKLVNAILDINKERTLSFVYSGNCEKVSLPKKINTDKFLNTRNDLLYLCHSLIANDGELVIKMIDSEKHNSICGIGSKGGKWFTIPKDVMQNCCSIDGITITTLEEEISA